ncbi:MAG: SIR2 family protein, partial [Chitinophagales bacterium]|nr:SIR2 family protein [Chitinophagales bacterium]
MAGTDEGKIWDLVYKLIEDEKCILIIGPEIAVMNSEKSINQLIKERIENGISGKVSYYDDDEFFHFTDEQEEGLALMDIQGFYDELKPNEIHEKIAEIPFHMIISVSPDLLMKKLFESKKLDFAFDYYNKQQNPNTIEKPTGKKPLIYNLFGNIEQEGSVVLTYTELFDYIISISGKDDMPQEIKNQIQNSRMVLFLGFKFEKWYFKLLLRLLKIQEGKNIRQAGKGRAMLPQIRNFYSDEFKIKFLEYSSEE